MYYLIWPDIYCTSKKNLLFLTKNKLCFRYKQHLGIDTMIPVKMMKPNKKIPFIVNGPLGHDHLNLCFEMTPMLMLELLEYKTQWTKLYNLQRVYMSIYSSLNKTIETWVSMRPMRPPTIIFNQDIRRPGPTV